MTLIKHQPGRWNTTRWGSPEYGFSGLLNDFFNHDFPRVNEGRSTNLPSVNVLESDKDFKLELAAPGFKKEDLKVSTEDSSLTISAEIEENSNVSDEKYTRKEFRYGSFKRSFTLPETVNIEAIKAEYKDGILYVSIPKKEEVVKNTNREIKVG